MPKIRVGSQIREPYDEAGYQIIERRGDELEVEYFDDRAHRLVREIWCKNDHYSGYVITVDGVGFEFIRSYVP